LGAHGHHAYEERKRRDALYRSGDCRDWRKIKTTVWREANRERWRLFERNQAGVSWSDRVAIFRTQTLLHMLRTVNDPANDLRPVHAVQQLLERLV